MTWTKELWKQALGLGDLCPQKCIVLSYFQSGPLELFLLLIRLAILGLSRFLDRSYLLSYFEY